MAARAVAARGLGLIAIVALLATAAAACGGEEAPARSELSPRLQAAWDRLEARGYEVVAVRAVIGHESDVEPALLVDVGESRVLVRAPEGRSVIDPPLWGIEGESVGLRLTVFCPRNAEIAGSDSSSMDAVARDSGLC